MITCERGDDETSWNLDWLVRQLVDRLSASELYSGALGVLAYCNASVIDLFIQSATKGHENYVPPATRAVIVAEPHVTGNRDYTPDEVDRIVEDLMREIYDSPTADGDDVPDAEKF